MFARDPTFTAPARNVANNEMWGSWGPIYPDLLLLIPLSVSSFSPGLCRFILKTWYQPTFSMTLLEFKWIAWTHHIRYRVCFPNNPSLLIHASSDVPLLKLTYWLIMMLLWTYAGVVCIQWHPLVSRASTRHWLMGLGCIPFLRSVLRPRLSDNSNLLSEVCLHLYHPFPPLQHETWLSSRLFFGEINVTRWRERKWKSRCKYIDRNLFSTVFPQRINIFWINIHWS